MISLNHCELTAAISALALAIANVIEDNDELDLVALVFTQLGDTLATISTQRDFCKK